MYRLRVSLVAFLAIVLLIAALAGSADSASGDKTPPSTPNGLAVTQLTHTSIVISWAQSTDNVGVAGYQIYRDGKPVATVTMPTFALSNLPCGTTATIGVEAFDAAGNRSHRAAITATTYTCAQPNPPPSSAPPPTHDTTSTPDTSSTHGAATPSPAAPSIGDAVPPSTPTRLRTTAIGPTTLALVWTAATDNVGVVGYAIKQNGSAVGTTSATIYGVTGLTCGTRYTFAVSAYDAAANASADATIAATTAACNGHGSTTSSPTTSSSKTTGKPGSHSKAALDTTPPTVPANLTVTGLTAETASLKWTASTDDKGVAGYGLYVNGALTSTTTMTTGVDTGLACGQTYVLGVDAYDAAGNRSDVASTTATTTACSTLVGGDLYVSPSGSDANACTVAAPCQSLNRAYEVAMPGQTIAIASGSYPKQTIAYDGSKSAVARVTFRPATGAFVYISELDLGLAAYNVRGPQHVVLQGLNVGYLAVWDGSDDVSLSDISGKSFDVLSYSGTSFGPANNISVTGGNFGPCQAPRDGACTVRLIGTNINVSGVTIHDATSTDLVNYHVDGMFVRGCQNCSVTNSVFYSNTITNIRVQNCCGLPANSNLTIANNTFGTPNDGSGNARGDGIDLDTPTPGLQIVNNTFSPASGPLFTDGAWGATGAQVNGNEMLLFPCQAGVFYQNNLEKPAFTYITSGCGPGDTLTTSAWPFSF